MPGTSKPLARLPPRRADMRQKPVNVFDSGHMSIDNIKSVYITAAINAEKRQMRSIPGLVRAPPDTAGAAGVAPARFGGTQTPVLGRDAPVWWYGGPPLKASTRGFTEEWQPEIPAPRVKAPMKLPADDVVATPPEDTEKPTRSAEGSEGRRFQRLGVVQKDIPDKVTRISHSLDRAPTRAPDGLGHTLPSLQGAMEYFPRRPEKEEYLHGYELQKARRVRLRDDPPVPPPVDPSKMAVKVSLFAPEDAAVLGPAPFDPSRRRVPPPPHGRVRKPGAVKITIAPPGGVEPNRMPATGPAGKARGARDNVGGGGDGGVAEAMRADAPARAQRAEGRAADARPAEREAAAPLAASEGVGAQTPPPDSSTGARRGVTFAAPVDGAGAQQQAASAAASAVLPRSRPMAFAGEDSRQTYRFGEAATHEEMAFDPVYPEKHAAKDTEVTYRFGERGEDDRRHRDNFDSVYSSAHAKKDTRSQIHFGDYEGPLGRSVLW